MFLTTADYLVMFAMLVIPLAIGFFYAWKDAKVVDRDEYLLGGRKMKVIPVSLSLFVTFQSAISLLGFPSDLYRYGAMVMVYYSGHLINSLFGYFTIIPLLYPLHLTSVFDYLEMRYKCHLLRLFCTALGMLQTFAYMVIAMLAPGLALQAAAGIPFWMSVALVGCIGTLYTAIGGIKSVIWADVFQALILFIGILLLWIRGAVVVGGVDKIWSIAEEGGRTALTTITPDPRVRHTWWGMIVGSTFLWIPNTFSQANIQRVSAMNSLKSARQISLLGIPCMLIYSSLLAVLAITMYSYFYTIRCDPLEGGILSNMNQMSLYFMLLVFQDFPGLAGFYMATIFSGALSTLSSGINALATNTVEDILAGWLKGVSERTVVIIAKLMVFVYGFAIVGMAYLIKSLQGPITQMTSIVMGAFGSVINGVFLMGCFVPWTNKYGASIGGVLTMAFNLWLMIGNYLYGVKTRPLPSPPTDQCSSLVNASSSDNNFSLWSTTLNLTSPNTTVMTQPTTSGTDDPYEFGFFLYDISYEWYGFIGTTVCCVCILVFSKLTKGLEKSKINAWLIVPMLRDYWQMGNIPDVNESQLESLHTNNIVF